MHLPQVSLHTDRTTPSHLHTHTHKQTPNQKQSSRKNSKENKEFGEKISIFLAKGQARTHTHTHRHTHTRTHTHMDWLCLHSPAHSLSSTFTQETKHVWNKRVL